MNDLAAVAYIIAGAGAAGHFGALVADLIRCALYAARWGF